MKLVLLVCVLCVASMTSCETARDTTEGATDLAGHAVHKTGHAVIHGKRKLESNL